MRASFSFQNLSVSILFGVLMVVTFSAAATASPSIVSWETAIRHNLWLLPIGVLSGLLSPQLKGRWSHPVAATATLFAGMSALTVIAYQGFNLLGYKNFTEFSITHYLTSHFMNFVAFFALALIPSVICWRFGQIFRRPGSRVHASGV